MEPFGAVAGALSVAALFNNCVTCFEYVQLGRHFAQDYERCQLKLDIAKARLSRWGQLVAIHDDPRFATDRPQDASVQLVQDVLEEIAQLFQNLQGAAKRYTRRRRADQQDSLVPLRTQDMQPVAQRLHSRLATIVSRRQEESSLLQKTAWALYDGKNFEKLVNEIRSFVDELEKLFPVHEGARRALVELEIEEIDDGDSQPALLAALKECAADVDQTLCETAAKKLEKEYGRRNYARTVEGEENARMQVGDVWTEAALKYRSPDLGTNEVDTVRGRGSSVVQIGHKIG
ncbi:prion-inhibition and propagation-domain-containing protein [Xylariomycetidae sp. FL2044]|nr:prion-inhibition and propagation-domain-containing protein [Xylariomycetidae sp. FL2044]